MHVGKTIGDIEEEEESCRRVNSSLETHDVSSEPLFSHLTRYSNYSLFGVLLLTFVAKIFSIFSFGLTGNYTFHSFSVLSFVVSSPSCNSYK